MRISIGLILLFLVSCTPLHHISKIQSDKRIKKTEAKNYTDKKALTQWWYYDCIFEDGSVLVFLFTPYQWWDDCERKPLNKSLFYLSYMNAEGTVLSQKKIFDASEVLYSSDTILAPCFKIIKTHNKNNRAYTVDFSMDSIKGNVSICSDTKAFSPFPRGSMSPTITRLFKRKVKGLAYRYSAHVPTGKVLSNIEIDKKNVQLAGKAYHEQGWFTGSPEKMGDGWTWFHFVSKKTNIFGTSGQFFCVEKEDKRLVSGLDKNCSLSEKCYSANQKNLLIGGTFNYNSKALSFSLCPTGKPSTPMICLPAVDTGQLWGTVVQKTAVTLRYKKTVVKEEGFLFLETCRMKKSSTLLP